MAKRTSLGVDIHLPGRKRPFTSITKASSDLIVLVAEKGLTVADSIAHIHFDDDAKDVLRAFDDAGHGQTKLADLFA